MAPSARPRPRAPTTGRQVFRVSITVRKARPSSPSRLAAGAGGGGGQDEGGDGLHAGPAGLGEEADVVGDGAAGDVHLFAVDDVIVAVAAGAGVDGGGGGGGGGAGGGEGGAGP